MVVFRIKNHYKELYIEKYKAKLVNIQNTSLFGVSLGMLGVVGFLGTVWMYMNTFEKIADGMYEILYFLIGILAVFSVIFCVSSFIKHEKSAETV